MEKLGLVLSGGASYGLAHIGVLKELEKNNIKFDVITGTSMGALVGGLYACGVSIKQMEEILTKFSRKNIVDLNFFALIDSGLIHGRKVVNFLKKLVGDKKIEELDIKYCAIAADLNSGRKIVIDSGSVVDAIRASISIPGIFKPVRKGKMCLSDGGACDNMPVEDARRLGATKILSVDVSSFYKKQESMKTPFDILIAASNLMVSNFVKEKKDKGDYCLVINQPNVKIDKLDNKNSFNAIRNGRREAKKHMDEIKKALNIN